MLVGAAAGRSCCSACVEHRPCCSSETTRGAVAAAMLRDPQALKVEALRGGQTMGLIGVWPSDVDALKRSIDPSMVATDAAVKACAQLSPGERSAWADFFKAWKGYHDEPTPFLFGLGAKYDEGLAYRQQLGGWQEQLRRTCTIPGPAVSTEDEHAALFSALKWGAAAVIAASVVYGVREVLK